MMKHEFEALAGYEVTIEDYNKIIEPMYMATDLSKEEFAKVINKKRFALKPLPKIEKWMQKIAAHIKETCTHYRDNEAWEELEKAAEEYRKRIGASSYYISESEKWSCWYPSQITFIGMSGGTFQVINLI